VVALAGSSLTGCSGEAEPESVLGGAADRSAPPPGLAYLPPEPGSYELPVIQQAADGAVLDADGTPRRLRDYLDDRIVLMSFVYLSCKDATACPLAMAGFHLIEMDVKADPALRDRVRLVTLSFDPERDTPEAMLEHGAWDYLETPWQRRPWSLLTCASPADLQPILEGYGQTIVPEFDEQGRRTGDFAHVMKVFLIDRQQRVRNIYGSGFLHPALAMADLRTLAMAEE
jgi:cytochrome c peroxidase